MEPASSISPEVDFSATMMDKEGGGDAGDAPVMEKRPYLKAKFRVGSCNGPKNFPSQETVFHPDDVPVDKRANKARVKEFLLPNKLGSSDWDTCTTGATQSQSNRTRVNSEFDRSNMYRYNYRAEVLPPKQTVHVNRSHRFKTETLSEAEKKDIMEQQRSDPVLAGTAKRMEEMAVHPHLAGKTKWAQSTIPVTKELRANLNRIATGSKANSTRKNSMLKNYVSVEKKEEIKRLKMRELKKSGADISKFIMTGKLEDEPLIPTYNRMAKEPSLKYRVYSHTGKWEMNEAEGCMMWSDTGSFSKDGPGDCVKVVNKAAFNFASPCEPRGENLNYTRFDIKSTQSTAKLSRK